MKVNNLTQLNLNSDLSVLLQNLGNENENFSFQDLFLFLINSLNGQDLVELSELKLTETNLISTKDTKNPFFKPIENEKDGKEETLNNFLRLFVEFINLSINNSNSSSSNQRADENIPNFLKNQEVKQFIKILKDDLILEVSYKLREEPTLFSLWEDFFITAQREFIKFLKASSQDLNTLFEKDNPIFSLREKFNALPEDLKNQIREKLFSLTELSTQEIKPTQEINFYNHAAKEIKPTEEINFYSPAAKGIKRNNLIEIAPEKGENLTEINKDNKIVYKNNFIERDGINKEEALIHRTDEILNKGQLKEEENSLLAKIFINKVKKINSITPEETPLNKAKGFLGTEGLEAPKANSIKLLTGTLKTEARIGLENISQVIKDFTIELKPSGERKALLELEPPELGKMELMVKVKDGEVELFARVEKAETLSQLRQELSQIKTELESLGLKLKDFQLSLGFTGEGRNFYEKGESEQRKFKPKKIDGLFLSKIESEPIYFHKGSLYKIV